ncbi:MAG: DUF177 domain-containing protein [Bdellovibrionales bacterium]|nr:DUF177 domain-containing protein [Bdellovibrionales bacterium]
MKQNPQPFQIRIKDISPERPLQYDQELALDSLNARMNEGVENDIFFTVPPKIEIKISKTTGGARLVGKVTSAFTQPCGRCADELERKIEIPMDYMLKPLDSGNPDELDGEPGVLYFQDDQLDLEDLVQETLILAMSAYWLPEKDESGKCKLCHKVFTEDHDPDKKKSFNLGEIFKKAGISNN